VPSRFRVVAGYAAAVLAVALARPTAASLLVGLSLAMAGEAVRIWASGHIEKTRRLATGGPYAHTRNPLYVGSTILALGVAVAGGSSLAAVPIVAYFAAFYPAVIKEESGFLRAKFGAEYDAWAAAVPAFLPRLTPGGPRATRFDWARVAVNREWRTVAALPLVALALWGRSRLPFL
jgi:protein-S-isoprenylcysteine O-methyltransferase Ste14